MIQNEPGDEATPTNGALRFSFDDAYERADAIKRWPEGLAEVDGREITGSWTRLMQHLQRSRDSQLRVAMALGERALGRIVTYSNLAAFVEVAANTIRSIDAGTKRPSPKVIKQYGRKMAELWQYVKAGPELDPHRSHWTKACITVAPGGIIAEMVNAIVSGWSTATTQATSTTATIGAHVPAGRRFPLRVAAFQLATTFSMLKAIRRDTNHLPQHLISTLYIRWMSLSTVRRLLEPPALFGVSELHAFADNLERICQDYSPHTLDLSKARSRQSMDVVLLEPWPLLPPFIGMLYDAVDADNGKSLSSLLWSAAAVTEDGTLGCEIPGAYLIPPDYRRHKEYREMLSLGEGPPVERFLQELRSSLPAKRVGG